MDKDNLSLAEQFIILSIHPTKHRYLIDQNTLYASMFGAYTFDLVFSNQIELHNKKVYRTKTKKEDQSNNHQNIITYIESRRSIKKIRPIISALMRKGFKTRRQLINDLQQKGYVALVPKRFLFIHYKGIRLINISYRQDLILQLKTTLYNSTTPDHEQIALLSLIDAGRAYRILTIDRSERRILRKKMKNLAKSNVIAQSVKDVIIQIRAASSAAASAAAAGAAAGS